MSSINPLLDNEYFLQLWEIVKMNVSIEHVKRICHAEDILFNEDLYNSLKQAYDTTIKLPNDQVLLMREIPSLKKYQNNEEILKDVLQFRTKCV